MKTYEHFGIRDWLWRIPDHFNHLHVNFKPEVFGTPKCAGGSAGLNGPSQEVLDFKEYVFDKYKDAWWGGDFVCRKIAGSNTWSQHAYGRAIDVMVPTVALGDKIAAWLDSPWEGDDDMTDEQKKDLAEALEKAREANARFTGIIERLEGDPEPPDSGKKRWGWRAADRFLSEPE